MLSGEGDKRKRKEGSDKYVEGEKEGCKEGGKDP